MGTHEVVECGECGRALLDANSCRHRFCPLCSIRRGNVWLAKWKARLLPVEHFHLVFTIPHELNFFWQQYPSVMGDIFFEAVSLTLARLLADPQWLGGRAAILAMFQTWDNELKRHPHMHILLSAGGIDAFGRWISLTRGPEFFIPHLVISKMFRGIFMKLVRKAEYAGAIKPPAGWSFSRRMKFLSDVGNKAFVVQIFGPYAHGVGVLKYFASHVRGGPIANSRILSVTRTHVTFRMQPRPDLTELECTLEIGTFLERFLSHIPPPGFHIVRAYGLYSPSSKHIVTGLPKPAAITGDGLGDEDGCAEEFCPRCGLPIIHRDLASMRRPVVASTSRSPRLASQPTRASPMTAVV